MANSTKVRMAETKNGDKHQIYNFFLYLKLNFNPNISIILDKIKEKK